MSWAYRTLIRPVLFCQDSEQIHNQTLRYLAWAGRHDIVCGALAAIYQSANLPVKAFGLTFPNPVGLAAGMDKHAAAVPVWAALGFGFCELGGVTLHAQPGNPMPRMFRAVPDRALINRMGFNNAGAPSMSERLASWRQSNRWPDHPVGINLGKSKITPLETAAQDYSQSLKILWPHADFFVVNVSSPNTPGLRQLQDPTALDEILATLQETNSAQASANSRPPKPILVKVAPDLEFTALDELLTIVTKRNVAGIVATNTTIARPSTHGRELQKIYAETGGLSGQPLAKRSTEVIRHIFQTTKGSLPIIGVGGVFDADDAWKKIIAGASLVQIYTGLVFEGPALAKNIVSGLRAKMKLNGFTELSQAVGTNEKGL